MPKILTTPEDYDLNETFSTRPEGSYTSEAASKLAAWVRFTPGSPTDLGPHSLVCQYDGTESTSTGIVGSSNRNIATFDDTGNQNARITPVDKELSMTTLTSETVGAGTDSTDLPFSVSLWANRGNISGTDYLFGKQSGKWHAYVTAAGQVVFRIMGANTGELGIYYHDISDFQMQQSRWYHFAFTYDGRGGASAYLGLKFYVNGVEIPVGTGSSYVGSGTYDGSDLDADGPLFIGAAYQAGISEFTGDMAEFAVWKNHALTSSEVKAIYHGSSTASAQVSRLYSGITSLPPRVLLREYDRLGADVPLNLRNGDMDAHNSISALPYDDTNTISFLSSFGTAKIKIAESLVAGNFIDVTGSSGKVAKRFKFTLTEDVPAVSLENTDIPVPLVRTNAKGELQNLNAPKHAANLIVKAIKDNPDLDMIAEYDLQTLDRFDAEGALREEPINAFSVILKHKKPNTGSFIQGNLITKGNINDKSGATENTDNIFVEQFTNGLQSSSLITLGEMSALDGGPSSILATPNTSPTIQANTSVVKGISDRGYRFVKNYSITPFDEAKSSVVPNSKFEATGTEVKVLDGFASPIRSKTQLTIECNSSNLLGDPIYYASGTSTRGDHHPDIAGKRGSGFAYWSPSSKSWQMMHNSIDVSATRGGPFSAAQFLSTHPFGFTLIPSSTDDKTSTKGPYAKFIAGSSNNEHNRKVAEILRKTGLPHNGAGFPIGAQYNATSSLTTKMSSLISSPFLLEKIKVRVEGVFGLGNSVATGTFHSDDPPPTKNFFLLNQRSAPVEDPGLYQDLFHVYEETNHDKWITNNLAKVGHPYGRKGDREIVAWAKAGFISSNSPGVADPKTFDILEKDYDSLTVVDPTLLQNNVAISGTLHFEITPRVALAEKNLSVKPFQTYPALDPKTAGYRILGNPFGGADLMGSISGRQLGASLGSTLKAATGSRLDYPDSDGVVKSIVNKDQYWKPSPYLIFPEDDLIIGWQNLAKIEYDGLDHTGNTVYGTTEFKQAEQLVDRLQNVKITLYGSYVRDGKEFHDTLNQNLSTRQITEVIFGEPDFDQFDVEPLLLLTGSTQDALFFGDMFATENGVRGRRASIAGGKAGSTGSLVRNIGLFNETNFYKDSTTPHISHILKDKKFFTGTTALPSDPSELLTVGGTAREGVVLSSHPGSPSSKWLKEIGSFDDLDFTKAVAKFPASDFLTVPGAGPVTKAKHLLFDMTTKPTDPPSYKIFSGTVDFIKGVDSAGSPEIASLPTSEPPGLKASTDMKVVISSVFYAAPLTSLFGSTTFAIAKLAGSLFGVVPNIRGCRYGFINPSPVAPKAYFRRDRYGQFRDMMEQSLEASTIDLVSLDAENGDSNIEGWPHNDSPVKVRFFSRNGTPDIDPLDTNAQNLSIFSTSSKPYYDGLTVDRDVVNNPPPDMTDKTGIEEAISTIIDGDA